MWEERLESIKEIGDYVDSIQNICERFRDEVLFDQSMTLMELKIAELKAIEE